MVLRLRVIKGELFILIWLEMAKSYQQEVLKEWRATRSSRGMGPLLLKLVRIRAQRLLCIQVLTRSLALRNLRAGYIIRRGWDRSSIVEWWRMNLLLKVNSNGTGLEPWLALHRCQPRVEVVTWRTESSKSNSTNKRIMHTQWRYRTRQADRQLPEAVTK